jgi:excisionase family DNA binding protein
VIPPAKASTSTARPSARLLSAQAAAMYTGFPYTTIRDAAIRGHLPVVRIPGQRRMWFDRADLDRAIERWKERCTEGR